MMEFNVLVIDDDEIICKLICDTLKKDGISSDYCLTGEESYSFLSKKEYDVIFMDLMLPDTEGFVLFERLKEKNIIKNAEVILITSHGDTETGMKAMEKGFYDFIAKPFNVKELVFRVKRAKENALFRQKVKELSQTLEEGFPEIIGESPPMKAVFKMVRKVADTDSLVLIQGDTGTGKELVARAIHLNSSRKENVFIPVNCGALTETLLENELFGHEKGAFTGAHVRKFGILETGNQGTVFLDEINSASLSVQTKLLRFLENGEFLRVGGTELIQSKARVIVATNRDLKELVKAEKFREDLYYRLDVFKIMLPPLRQHTEDIPLLVDHFLEQYNSKFHKGIRMTKSAVEQMQKQDWPGNVRQLKNFLNTILLKNESGTITPDDLDFKDKTALGDEQFEIEQFKEAKEKVIHDFEKGYISKLLTLTKGNVLKASKISGMNRKNLIDKMSELGIDAGSFK